MCSPRDQCPHAGMSRPASAASEPRRSLGEQGPGGPPGGKRTIPEGRANLARLAARRGGFQMLWWPLSRRGLSRNRGGLLAAAMVARRKATARFPTAHAQRQRRSIRRTGKLAKRRTGHSRAARKVSGRPGGCRVTPGRPACAWASGPRQETRYPAGAAAAVAAIKSDRS